MDVRECLEVVRRLVEFLVREGRHMEPEDVPYNVLRPRDFADVEQLLMNILKKQEPTFRTIQNLFYIEKDLHFRLLLSVDPLTNAKNGCRSSWS